jgi:copper resistance protein B
MGHCTLTPPPAISDRRAPPLAPPPTQVDPNCPPEHAKLGHCTPTMTQSGTPSLPPVAPPPATALSGPEHAADTVFDPALMAAKRQSALINEHGGMTTSRVLVDRLELLARKGRDGYAWEGDAWFGGDYDKLWFKSEGEGEIGGRLEAAEVQALWSRTILPFFDFQLGVRHDVRPRPDRSYLAIGIQGLAPYWFEIDAAAFVSTKGDLTARFEAEYDQRITNQLFIQPRVEFDLAAQDVPELGVGSGLSSAELGLRLRYQFVPEFAPYIGIGYERRFGDTARFARSDGEDIGGWSLLLGIRAWF